MRGISFYIFFVLTMLLSVSHVFSQSVSLPTDPGRVTLTTGSEGITTITTDDGELLRGVAILFRRAAWIDSYDEYSYWFDENYYKTLADSGVNLFRIGLYDPGMNQFDDACAQNWPVTDFNNPDHVADYLARLDTIVDYCSKYGIYVDINFHQTPGTNDPNGYYGAFCDPDANNMSYIKELWTVTAPYFKNRTHVFYEPVNEPVKWWPYSYLEASQDYHIDSLAVIFKLVADLAPETHLSLFTFPNATCSWGGCEVGMKAVVDEYKSRYPNDVNWDNVSIAYHPYTTGGTSDPILELASAYAVFDSESNYPDNTTLNNAGYPSVTGGSAQRTESMDGELLVMQTNERLGISWNVWSTGSPDAFEGNWVNIILKDARAKDYIWFGQGPKYNLTVNYDSNIGSVTPSGGSYSDGTLVPLTAEGLPGYEFDYWSGDLSGSDNPKQITMNSDKTVTANFVSVPTYTLTTSATNGDILLSPEGGTYNENSIVTATDNPDPGYELDYWEGAASGSTSPVDITMDSNKSLTAHYKQIPGGSITARVKMTNGTSVDLQLRMDGSTTPVHTWTITGTEYSDYVYAGISGSHDNVRLWFPDNSTDIQVDYIQVAGQTYQAEDQEINTAAWTPAGCGTDSYSEMMHCLGYIDFGTIDFGTGDSPDTYSLIVTASPITGGSVNGSGDYEENSTATATATAADGYEFTDWDGASEANTTSVDITMDTDKTLTANFSPILVSSITIPEGDQSLQVDETVDLSVNVSPDDALNQSVSWDSDDENVATVDANGLVSAVAAGTANISATANDGSNVKGSVEVTVTDDSADGTISVFAKMISGTTDKLELIINYTTIHTWDISGSSYQEYTYSGLSGTGNLELYFQDNGTDMRIDYIVINGSTTMQAEDQEINEATWQDGSCGGNYKETMYCSGSIIFGNVDFGSGATPTYTLTTNVGTGGSSVEVDPDQASYNENEQVTFTANAQSGYSFDNWSGTETGTNNPLVINMTEDENITANFSPILVSSITIPEGDQNKEVGDADFTLTTSVSPSDALDPSINWASDNEGVATVTSSGVVSVVAAGTANISATANDGGGANASVQVTVTEAGTDPWYDLTATYYGNYFTGTTVNSSDFTWHADGSEWTGITFASDDELIVSNAGGTWSKITNTFASGTSVDISGNPVVSFKAKTTAGSDITFELRLEDSNGDNSFASYMVTLIGDGAYHEYDIPVADVFNFNTNAVQEVQLYYGNQTSVPCDIYIDDFEVGGDNKSARKLTKLKGSELLSLEIYPNPISNGKLNIQTNCLNEHARLFIYDTQGRCVYTQNIQTNMHSINIDQIFNKGLYMIKLQNDANTSLKKLIVY